VFDDVHYARNYLTNVIARLDFAGPIESLKSELPIAISDTIMRHFPVSEPTKRVAEQLSISPDQFKHSRSEFTQWSFRDRAGHTTLLVRPQALVLEYSRYHDFETLQEHFMNVVSAVLGCYTDVVGSRLGLRYINNLNLGSEATPLSWGEYINDNLLCLFAFCPQPAQISRVFHTLELNLGDHNVRFQSGMPNPDFPAPIKRRGFVLDLDAYSQSAYRPDQVSSSLHAFHGTIQTLFEASITDTLRAVLHEPR